MRFSVRTRSSVIGGVVLALALGTFLAAAPAQAAGERPDPPAGMVEVPTTKQWGPMVDTPHGCAVFYYLSFDGDRYGEPVEEGTKRRVQRRRKSGSSWSPTVSPYDALDLSSELGPDTFGFSLDGIAPSPPQYGTFPCDSPEIAEGMADIEQANAEDRYILYVPQSVICSTTQSGPGGSEILFSAEVDASDLGPGFTQEWTFSDGTTSTATSVGRIATDPGPFSGTFTATDGTTTSSDTCEAEVSAPELGMALEIVDEDGQPVPVSESPSVGQVVDVRMRVVAHPDGIGDLSGLAPVEEWVTATGPVEPAEEPDVPDGPFSLSPGEVRNIVFPYRMIGAGDIRFTSALQGEDAIGRIVQADAELNERVGGIGVELEISYPEPPGGATVPAEFDADNNGDGEVNSLDHIVTVTATATNVAGEALTDVRVRDAEEPVEFVNNLVGDGDGAAGLETLDGEEYPSSFGDLDVGASQTRTYRFEAIREIDADARMFLRGDTSDARIVSGFGEKRAVMNSHLAVQVHMDMEERGYASGDIVRLDGAVTNLLEDRVLPDGTTEQARPVAVLLTPITEHNAGGGFVSDTYGSATPLDSDPVIVQPGATRTVRSILRTQRSEVTSTAEVRYLVDAWEIPEADDAVAIEIDQSRIRFDEEDGSSAEHSTSLGPTPVEPDVDRCEKSTLDYVISCNLYIGLGNFAHGIAELPGLALQGIQLGANVRQRMLAYELYMLEQSLRHLVGDPEATQALEAEQRAMLQRWEQAKIFSDQAVLGVGDAMSQFYAEGIEAFGSGDYLTIAGWASRFAGENPDLTVGALTKLRMLRTLKFAAIADAENAAQYSRAVQIAQDANRKAAREAKEGIEQRIRASIARGENVAEAGVFKGDEDVTDIPLAWKAVAGARARDVKNLLSVASAEKVLIAFRSRQAISIDYLKRGIAYMKPQSVKAKNVNSIDTVYLGYPQEAYGRVELVEPPIDWTLFKDDGVEAALSEAAEAYVNKLKATHPELRDPEWAAEVQARLMKQAEWYPKRLKDFHGYETKGIELNFEYDQQGLPKELNDATKEFRKAEVKHLQITDEFGVVRRRHTLRMAGPDGTGFKHITGDIDIVAILNPDGSLIADAAKRTRIYNVLRELVGMQHGETATWINTEAQAGFLRDHARKAGGSTEGVDTLFVAGDDGRLRTGFFEEKFSSSTEGIGSTPEGKRFFLVSGAPKQVLTPPNAGLPAVIDRESETWRKILKVGALLAPGKAASFADGLQENQVDLTFNRAAAPIRTNRDGTVSQYVASSGRSSTPAPRAARRGVTGDPNYDEVLDRAVAAGIDLGDTQPDDGPGALGGTWERVPLAEAVAAGRPGRFDTTAITSLQLPSTAGETSVAVANAADLAMSPTSPWFSKNDRVVVDPGGEHEERAVVVSRNPLTFAQPLKHDHVIGTQVVQLTVPAVDPRLLTRVMSKRGTSKGWYRTPVTVSFRCAVGSAPLTGPCPGPVVLSGNGTQPTVSRTIQATDGGAATAQVGGIRIDRAKPLVRVKGVKKGKTYRGKRKVRCKAKDRHSGVASCRVKVKKRGVKKGKKRFVYTVVARDRAGNRTVKKGSFFTRR